MKKFLKSTEVSLINGGYLSQTETGVPVFNATFVKAQQHAEYVVTFAKLAKTKDFEGKKADSLKDLIAETKAELASKAKTYVEKPAKVEKKLTEQLAEEALSFIKFEEKSSKVQKMNAFLQQFNVISEFEEFGLFFEEDIVKLNKIYKMEEIIEAVQSTIDLLED